MIASIDSITAYKRFVAEHWNDEPSVDLICEGIEKLKAIFGELPELEIEFHDDANARRLGMPGAGKYRALSDGQIQHIDPNGRTTVTNP